MLIRFPTEPGDTRSYGAGGDGGVRRLPGANRFRYRAASQLCGGGDLQTGGRWLRSAALSDGPGATEVREGEPRPATEATRNGREDAQLREEDEKTEPARRNPARRPFPATGR